MREHDGPRVLIYSHDTFGLGHLRRCRTIAHSLVAANKTMSVLILSGSPIIGSFDFRARVDFVRAPGVIKLRSGQYTSLNLLINIEQTLAMRSSIIQHTADTFDPDVLIVDKEPLGLRGEVLPTLEMLKRRGTRLVLGLRDVMDDPGLLVEEWERKNVVPALSRLYDDVWVYGLPQFCDPLAGIDVPSSVRRKLSYTGYLRRTEPLLPAAPAIIDEMGGPYLLVTAGGGGDGEDLFDWVLRAYESRRPPTLPALMVFGPFLKPQSKAKFMRRVGRLDAVKAITFDANLETLVAHAAGVVAMGGYNTFCEILSFDKRALLVPRTRPRMEQAIRAHRAQELGLVSVLASDGPRDARAMATALHQLPQQPLPSEVVVPGLLDGLDNVNRLVERGLADRRARAWPQAVARQGR